MRITQPVFNAFLHCPTKAYLVACGEVGFGAQAELAGIADNYHRFSWSDAAASGQLAVRWRQQWERSRDESVKKKLIVYNAEDCAAAKSVDASTLKRHYPQRFGEVDFALPEFQRINDAAQWDYQRDRVHLRSHRLSGRRRTKSPTRSASRLDRIIDLRDDRPSVCRNCGSGEIK